MDNNLEIHWWDFPDNIRVKVDDEYRHKLFQESNNKIANRLGISVTTARAYKVCYYKKFQKFIPVSVLKKLHNLYNIPYKTTEKHIVAYRCWCMGEVNNPNLPIIESSNLFQIIGNFYGDGSAEEYVSPTYCNTNEGAINEFRKIVYKVFGDVSMKYLNKHDIVRIPSAITQIIKKFYSIKSFNTYKSRIPNNIKSKNPNFLIGIIKAFIIDEGHVEDSGVLIWSCNYKLIKDLKYITKKIGYKTGKIVQGDNMFNFKILSNSIPKLIKDIGSLPIKEKDKRLKFIIIRSKRDWYHKKIGITRGKIIHLLKKKSQSALELAYKLNISTKTIREFHLSNLEKENLVFKDVSSRPYRWYIKG